MDERPSLGGKIFRDRALRLSRSSSTIGLLVATTFFAASLTPSLLPRTALIQGVISGAALAVGYALGLFMRWLWTYMELPVPSRRAMDSARPWIAGACLLVAIATLSKEAEWQNSVRRLMGLEPVTHALSLKIALVAFVTFTLLLALGWLFSLIWRRVSQKAQRLVPRRIANVIGLLVAVTLFWSIASGVLLRALLHRADASFQELDALIKPERTRPASALKVGSDASLLKWDELGRQGREFIATGPTSDKLQACSGKSAMEPLRVYVGLRSAPTHKARARLALEELKRVGGFARSTLVIVTPTGTGWVDPEALDSLEYLTNGDVASVAMQYSYLGSWLAIFVEPDYGAEAARALFTEIYEYWTQLPKGSRPKLYLHGLSLGAMHSEQSAPLFEVLRDPFNGALWSGPPYQSKQWASFTAARNPGSPAWLPSFKDGSLVRFMNQSGKAASSAPWGPMRIVYLQYASDAVTFFEYSSFYREPDWLKPPRGPDVSPSMSWYPVVTFLQLAADVPVARKAPIGFGHLFASEHYVDAWLELTTGEVQPSASTARLKQCLQRDANVQ